VFTNAPETIEERSLDGASYGDGSRAHDKGLKKVASLIERFEANESIQREWEQNNAKQNSVCCHFLFDTKLGYVKWFFPFSVLNVEIKELNEFVRG